VRAYVLDELGQPGQVRDLPDPKPEDGEVLVRIQAAGVNPWDAVVVGGGAKSWAEHRFPFVPGVDGAGVIAAVGSGVTGFKVGDEVVLSAGDKPFYGAGTFAELVAVPAEVVAHKPKSFDVGQASTIPLAGLTALAAAEEIGLEPGKVIAVIGAAGAVGSFFTQIASKSGAKLLALARPQNADYVRSLGATEVIDHTTDPVAAIEALEPDGLDAIADFTGNATLVAAISTLLKDGGVVATSVGRLINKERYAKRGSTVEGANRLPLARLPDLTTLIDREGIAAPQISWRPLDDAAQALDQVGKRHNRGKVVLKID
jgi:NADPH2:quinone reductase